MTVLPGLCLEQPALNRTRKRWEYNDQDFWPSLDWHNENWANCLYQNLERLKSRLGEGVHYEDLQSALTKLFGGSEVEEDSIGMDFDF